MMEKLLVDEDLTTRALMLAMKYHGEQLDKAGMPYTDHLLRVGMRSGFKAATREEFKVLMAIGLLHDILEDTSLTFKELEIEIQNKTVSDAVLLLTRLDNQKYMDYIDLVSHNTLATMVKLSDLEDHLETLNGYTLPESLSKRYKKAKQRLLLSNEYLKNEYEESL